MAGWPSNHFLYFSTWTHLTYFKIQQWLVFALWRSHCVAFFTWRSISQHVASTTLFSVRLTTDIAAHLNMNIAIYSPGRSPRVLYNPVRDTAWKRYFCKQETIWDLINIKSFWHSTELINFFISHSLWQLMMQYSKIYYCQEDRANSPVLKRLDLSSASVSIRVATFLALWVPQNSRSTDKTSSSGIRLQFQNWCDTKTNTSQHNTQFWIFITFPM